MSRKYLVTTLLSLAFLGGCETNPSKEDIGMVTEAVVGGRIGRSMDRDDRHKTARALDRSREDHVTTWRNPDNGQLFSVTPTRTYQGATGRCREFEASTRIDGHKEVVQGTACRQPDGNWKTS